LTRYEIRIFDRNAVSTQTLTVSYLNDGLAISAGHRLSGAFPFQVWRESVCILRVGSEVPDQTCPV
jgi:hypothetical protein